MHRIVDTAYGADADGNRYVTEAFYELTDEDSPEIVSQIIEFIQSSGELPSTTFEVQLIDPVTEHDVTFDINPFDYISEAECLTYIEE